MHVIGTAGHVDHGKSSLVQRLTGMDPDRLEEEKRRGLTIDLGFAWLTLPSGREIGLVDVPGHERFIKNMLAGVGGITICLFVVAANEGWKPQSAEHLSILQVLGVTSGVVALTKCDTVDEETLQLATFEVQERIASSILAGAPVVVCSAVTGEGIDTLLAVLDEVVASTPPAPDLGRPRLWIDRAFSITGAGTVVTGTLAGGSFSVADEVEVAPEGVRARVRTIQSHKKETIRVGPGTRAALNLVGLDRTRAGRGQALVKPAQWRATSVADATIQVLAPELSGLDYRLTERGAYLLYVGSAETPVRLKIGLGHQLRPGESGLARLHLRDKLPLARGDRFVLRDAGRVMTFGGGEVLDPLPHRSLDVQLLQRLVGADPHDALTAFVEAEGAVEVEEALFRSGSSTVGSDRNRLDSLLVSDQRLTELLATVTETVRTFHLAHPLERGISKERLRAKTGLTSAAFEELLAKAPEVAEEGATVRLQRHSVTLAPDQERARAALVARIESEGMTPPLTVELGAGRDLLRALTDAGDLVKIGDFYLTSRQASEVRSRVRAAIQSSGPQTVAQIRDLLGTSRKYAVPLCEWLDSSGATRRQGDVRHLGPRP
jgi:selenocysteine-specific elongation factor